MPLITYNINFVCLYNYINVAPKNPKLLKNAPKKLNVYKIKPDQWQKLTIFNNNYGTYLNFIILIQTVKSTTYYDSQATVP